MKFLLAGIIFLCSVLPCYADADLKDSVVIVRSTLAKGKSEGTGFFIAQDRVMTAGHVVEESKSVVIVTRSGIHAAAEVIFYSAKMDLAILAVAYNSQFHLGFVSSPPQGSNFVIIGHPFGIRWVELYGRISGHTSCGDSECLLLDAALIHGVSGAPIIHNGKVIGVALSVITVKGIPMSGYGVGIPTEAFMAAIGGYLEKS